MRTYRIALLPGDGPGPAYMEGLNQALQLLAQRLRASAMPFQLETACYDIGMAALRAHGDTLPPASRTAIEQADASLIGLIDKEAEQHKNVIGLLRRELTLYADVRPIRPLGPLWALKKDIDIVCIRESTEGFLADRNMHKGSGEMMPTEDVVVSMRVLTREACRRIAVFAFEYARAHGRKSVTAVHKANVLRLGCGFFLNIVREVAAGYPDIALYDDVVDHVAHQLIAAPERYDILLMTNLMGDILSDEASALVSGMTGSANIGARTAVFFPVTHLVDVRAGADDAVNPVPLFLSAVLMLAHLGLHEAARVFEDHIAAASAVYATPLSGRAAEAADAFIRIVCEHLQDTSPD